jgi:hypothetical protein
MALATKYHTHRVSLKAKFISLVPDSLEKKYIYGIHHGKKIHKQ